MLYFKILFYVKMLLSFISYFILYLLENGKKRGTNKNQESRKRELKERKRRSQSKSKSSAQPVII